MARLSCRCPDELARAVDEVRGGTPRERWLRDAITLAVDMAKGSGVDVARVGGEFIQVSHRDVVDREKAVELRLGKAGKSEDRDRPVPRMRTEMCVHRVPATAHCRYCDV